MAGIEQPRSPRSAEHARLANSSPDTPGNWKAIGPYVSERAWGTVREDYSADGKPGDTSHTNTRARAPIGGTRTVSPASATVTSACVSHWRSGTGAIRSSRNASSGSPAWKEITARTQRSTGGTSMQRRPHRGCAGATTIRRPSFPMLSSTGERKAQKDRARIRTRSIPGYSRLIATGRSRRNTPRPRQTNVRAHRGTQRRI